MLADPYTPLYTKVISITGSRVADFKANKPFRILVANFSDKEVTLIPHQVVATASDNTKNLVKFHLSHAEVLV